jgi:hypothetical protein
MLDKRVLPNMFPLRENYRLTLYQDADTPKLPQVNFYFYLRTLKIWETDG